MMLMTTDANAEFWSGGHTGVEGGGGDDVDSGFGGEFEISDDDFDLSIDLDSFYSILGEDPPSTQELGPEDFSFQNVSQGDSAAIDGNHEYFPLPKDLPGFQGTPPLGTYFPGTQNSFISSDLEPSDFRMWGSELLLETNVKFDYGKRELSAQKGTHDCYNASSFPEGVVNHIPDFPDNACHVRGDTDSKCMPYGTAMEYIVLNKQSYDIPSENSMATVRAPEDNSCTSLEILSSNAIHTEANRFPVSDHLFSDFYQPMQFSTCMDDIPFAELTDGGLTPQFKRSNETKIEEDDVFRIDNVGLNSNIISNDLFGSSDRHVPHMSGMDYNNLKGFTYEDDKYMSPFGVNYIPNRSLEPLTQKLDTANQSQQPHLKKEVSNEFVTPHSSGEIMEDAVTNNVFPSAGNNFSTNKELKQLFPCYQPHISRRKDVVHSKDVKENMPFPFKKTFGSEVVIEEVHNRNHVKGGCMVVPSLVKKQMVHIKNEKEGRLTLARSFGSNYSKPATKTIVSSSFSKRADVDDDSDICILEDISMPPPHSNPSLVNVKQLPPSQHSPLYDSHHHLIGDGVARNKANDERDIFRVALQDLSQPRSEAVPPEGVLAVPLLRHQKIALSWMVLKETANLFCSGGILADDQGLGKTISTIALILKERSPSSKAFQNCTEKRKLETLNLEDDDEPDLAGTNSIDAFVPTRGRPAAGTLVVCPTSVLRQWADELQNKVTEKANLSVLVYHGSNRTKDPGELAKYDVVVTTYSIVSMEVPKQPLVDKDDEEKQKEVARIQSRDFASSRKRKYPPNSSKRSLKDKKGIDSDILESSARPLAKVGWFRVVLDEAQSIKNHRTQVARACWGLRAKRRWCLSGTPIQNAIDDLYSYFRFLRYDPYAVYKSFCSTIKVPINKNPTNGYRKLQAVLKTIMLRRTKGTFLDGEPIINLPPKSVELKRVDFSKEERAFYSQLEADSRAQFEMYAAAGTVKQNYVNILLMLLRLRQACDHPLLVKGSNSKSIWKSSVEMAKKVSEDKRTFLLTCLEGSMAICGICNDPPEDAVVSICGHVFCSQCMYEHLTGDDNQCPSRGCKVQLSVSLVYSKATLRCSLDAQSAQGNPPGSSGCELVETLEPRSDGLCFDSSKIKAALEVLNSLSKPHNGTVRSSSLRTLDETASSPEASSDSQSLTLHTDTADKANRSMGTKEVMNGSIKVGGEKAIMFSQWTGMLDLLEECLKTSSIQYRRLDGTMSVLARDKAVKDFNTHPEVSVMIMSLKAASLGLNMVAACHVVLLDLWWNPTTEDQAIDRAHRIGQTRPVTVLRLTVKDTVEDRILALQQKKRKMVASAFGEDETGSRQTRLTVEDLKYLFMV